MSLLQESFRALWAMTLPVGLCSWALVSWSLRRGHLEGAASATALARQIKALAASGKRRKKESRKGPGDGSDGVAGRRDPVHSKWMKFGGGFYGIVGFYTYLVIEGREIIAFVNDFGGLWATMRLDIGTLVQLLVESIVNFVAALGWPLYWLYHLPGRQPWLLFLAAYLGYWLGLHLALRRAGKQ